MTAPTDFSDLRAVPLGPAHPSPSVNRLPVSGIRAVLGFPSPAEDFSDDGIDLNELLVRNPPATFFYRAEGWSMMMAGICDGDILIVDRSVQPRDGDIVLATWDGNQPTCKVLKVCQDHIELHSRNPHCAHIVLTPETEAEVFAITGVVRSLRHRGAHRG